MYQAMLGFQLLYNFEGNYDDQKVSNCLNNYNLLGQFYNLGYYVTYSAFLKIVMKKSCFFYEFH